MPVAEDSPAALVARFLRSNHYDETLEAFLREANLPPDTGSSSNSSNAFTIEKVLEEKREFDLSLDLEKTSLQDVDADWKLPAPTTPHTITTLPISANILHVSVAVLATPRSTLSQWQRRRTIIITTASRTMHVLSTKPPYSLCTDYLRLPVAHDAPILSTAVLRQRWLFTTSMSGRLTCFDMLHDGEEVSSRTDHGKYAVRSVIWDPSGGRSRQQTEDDKVPQIPSNEVLLATAGWDARVLVYRIELPRDDDDSETLTLPNPAATLALPTNPESILFVAHPDSPTQSSSAAAATDPLLLLSRRDSTLLHYYALPALAHTEEAATPTLLGTQNLTPHSLAWTTFTPTFLSPHPTDPTRLAIATSSTPHMRLLVVRLLFPPLSPMSQPQPQSPATTREALPLPADQARHALALANTEDAAILQQTNTLAPQTAYSTPWCAWRPDGSGVWVNGDDGVVRGMEVGGKGGVRGVLKGDGRGMGHEAGCKVRCLWAGGVGGEGRRRRRGDVGEGVEEEDGDGDADGGEQGEEWVVSGGFDRRVVVWRCT